MKRALMALLALTTLAHFSNGQLPVQCDYNLVETIPEGLTFESGPTSLSTTEAFLSVIDGATSSLDIAAFYFSLRATDVMADLGPTTRPGEMVLEALVSARKRGVALRVLVDSSRDDPLETFDLKLLTSLGAKVQPINVTQLMGNGVQHAKFMLADKLTFYVGSANMDWRSLSQVKELGIMVTRCQPLGEDLSKSFETFWHLGNFSKLPSVFPDSLTTTINEHNPLPLQFGKDPCAAFISNGPKPMCSNGRTDDLDAILHVIRSAKKFVHIAVMDYYPMTLYTKPPTYWPIIDDELKSAVVRGVKVRLLASHWRSTRRSMVTFLRSLDALHDYNDQWNKGNMEAKLFKVPSTPAQARIPYARVNHNKYVITDQDAFIGTSNWSGDYFTTTAGVALVVRDRTTNGSQLTSDLVQIFERDWNSEFAHYARNYTFEPYPTLT
ncbi:5'-3' exonuclease PLD3 [Halotydeus destructor]|nr:5'-3' exonuclease PLD3 [Halotydeus destructor]